MSSTTVETVEPKPKSAAKMRKRAPKACLSCRSRKVRCDVSQRGRPCMNCYLDNETCVVTGRASRFRRGQRGENEQVSYPPYLADECAHGRTAEDVVNSRTGGQIPPSREDDENDNASRDVSDLINRTENQTILDIDVDRWTAPGLTQQNTANEVLNEQRSNRVPSPIPVVQEATTIPLNTFNSFTGPEIPLWVGDQRIAMNADVTYSYYPFIKTGNLHNIMPQDVNYLESQGCLRVPTRAILDEFVQQYFLHIHPIMPILNEGDFWDMYCNPSSAGSTDQISLVFLQGLLFSSCNFISKSSIKALGFPNIRTARATFYRRTKLLFDFDTETSLVDLAQTALLLSFWATNWSLAAKKLNSTWLGIAIQNAKSSDAHLYAVKQNYSSITDPVQHKKQNILKRLWWCCLIRDRILALGVRRSLQISRAHFDLDANPGLGYTDLADEVDRSKVYNAETKRCLIEIFVQLGELCSVLTDLVTLVFPLDDVPGWDRDIGSEGTTKLKECKASLRKWYKATTLRFPRLCGGSTPRMTNASNQLQHDSVILYTNLMYMHYHSARAALCHHEVLQLAVACTSPNLSSNLREFSNIYENRHELQDAACSVTECLKELLQLRLVRWLPISAVACTALPLVLHIIDVKLSSQNKNRSNAAESDPQLAAKQHRLNILIEAMKTYQPQYDGVDYISETIRHIINIAQLDAPASAGVGISGLRNDGKQANISEWTDILASQPGYYLRLAMTMDLCFSKGRLAEESDFPANLRGLFAADFSSIRALVANRKTAPAQNQSSYFMPNPAANIIPGTVRSLSSDEESNSPNSLDGAGNGATNPNSNSTSTSDPRNHSHHINPPTSGAEVDMSGISGMFNIDNLASEVLAAWGADAVDPDQAMCYEGQGDDDWIERAWSDEEIPSPVQGHGQMHNQGHAHMQGQGPTHDQGTGTDKEAARVLLDALQNDGVSCGV